MLMRADVQRVVEETVAEAVAGCSCSQAVASVFGRYCGLDEKLLLQLSSGLAGGVAGAGETCGVVTAGIVVIGATYGPRAVDDVSSRIRTVRLSAEFMNGFARAHGSTLCSKLNHGADLQSPEAMKALRESGRPEQLIRSGAELLAALLVREQ